MAMELRIDCEIRSYFIVAMLRLCMALWNDDISRFGKAEVLFRDGETCDTNLLVDDGCVAPQVAFVMVKYSCPGAILKSQI